MDILLLIKRRHQNKRKEANFEFWFKNVKRITIVLNEIFNWCNSSVKTMQIIKKWIYKMIKNE